MPDSKSPHPEVRTSRRPATALPRQSEASWPGMTAIIVAILGIYLCWLPVFNVILALLAIIFGILGVRTRERAISVVAIVVGILNAALSVLALGAWWLVLMTTLTVAGDWLDEHELPTSVSSETLRRGEETTPSQARPRIRVSGDPWETQELIPVVIPNNYSWN